jgi:regulator of RNase E activity RraA
MLGEVPAGHVAVYACDQDVSAHLGELSVTSLKARGVAGCVLDGGCRDVRFILDEGFPVFARFVTPEDSTWRWELEATQVPVTIGNVEIEPGDWVVGDDDGVVVVPQASAVDVLAEAERKAATESEIRGAVREGMPPLEAYERFGTF